MVSRAQPGFLPALDELFHNEHNCSNACCGSHVRCCSAGGQFVLPEGFARRRDSVSAIVSKHQLGVDAWSTCSHPGEPVAASLGNSSINLGCILRALPDPPPQFQLIDLTNTPGQDGFCETAPVDTMYSRVHLPRWGQRETPIVIDLRGSQVNLTDAILANELVPISTTNVRPGMQCPQYALVDSPQTRVLVDPGQTSYHDCTCTLPWVHSSAATNFSVQQACVVLPEHVHALANPVLPLPNAGHLLYDPDLVWLSVAFFSFTAMLASGILLCTSLLQVCRIQGLLRSKTSLSLPGVVTDVLGYAQVDYIKDPPNSNVTMLQCAPHAITLVVIRMDPLEHNGNRPPLPEETAKTYMEKVRLMLKQNKRKAQFIVSEFDPTNFRIVLSFHKARNALASAFRLQREMGVLKVKRMSEWYLNALPRSEFAAHVDPDGKSLFHGILPAIGIHTAPCADIHFHREGRQIDYGGRLADIAAALARSAAPGQVLMTFETFHSVSKAVDQTVQGGTWGSKAGRVAVTERLTNDSVTYQKPNCRRSTLLEKLRHQDVGSEGGKDYIAFDMGMHQLDHPPECKVHVYQAVRLQYVYRVQAYSLYRIPSIPKAISFFQAAGVHEAIHGFPLPHMCIVFCTAHGFQQLQSKHALCAKQSLAIFNFCVSATLVLFHGYRCKERNGTHMLSFHSVSSAIEWGLSLHKLLLEVKWPVLLDSVDVTAIQKKDGRIIGRGIRANIGVYADQPDDLVLHSSSGRTDYFGTFVNRCARVLACASSGQIVGLQEHVAEALEYWKSQETKSDGEHPRGGGVAIKPGCSSSRALARRLAKEGTQRNASPPGPSRSNSGRSSVGGDVQVPDQAYLRDEGVSLMLQHRNPATGCKLSNMTRKSRCSATAVEVQDKAHLLENDEAGNDDDCYLDAWYSEEMRQESGPLIRQNGPLTQCCQAQLADVNHLAYPQMADCATDQQHHGTVLNLRMSAQSALSMEQSPRNPVRGFFGIAGASERSAPKSKPRHTLTWGGAVPRTQSSEQVAAGQQDTSQRLSDSLGLLSASSALQDTLTRDGWPPGNVSVTGRNLSGSNGQHSPRAQMSSRLALRSHGLEFPPNHVANRPVHAGDRELPQKSGPVAESADYTNQGGVTAESVASGEWDCSVPPSDKHGSMEDESQNIRLPPAFQEGQVPSNKTHCVDVLVHEAGVFKLKGVDKPVCLSCVSLADTYQQHVVQEQVGGKVQRLADASELLASFHVNLPVILASVVGNTDHMGSSTVAGTQVENHFKSAYVDVSWTSAEGASLLWINNSGFNDEAL